MRQRTVDPKRLEGVPEWFFRWRPRSSPWVPKLIALVVVGGGFVLLVTSVRIRVDLPEKVSPRRASVIYLGNDRQGRALSLKAQEGGPFPSRFDLSQWGGFADLEAAAMETVRFQVPAYLPEIENLPNLDVIKPLTYAARGESYFPAHVQVLENIQEHNRIRLKPVLYALSGISKDGLPAELPEFEPLVEAEMTAGSLRFLLRLNPAGGVMECVSLEKGGEKGVKDLEKWLQQIKFEPDHGNVSRWIAVGIGFTNQLADGTDAE